MNTPRENDFQEVGLIETFHALSEHLNNLRKRILLIVGIPEAKLPSNDSLYTRVAWMIEAGDVKYDDLSQIAQLSLREYDHFYILIDNLLGYYSALGEASGKLHVQRKPGNLAAVVNEVVDLFQPWADERDISYELEIPYEAKFYFDKEKLRRAIVNIVANAVKYSEPRLGAGPQRFIRIILRRHSTDGDWALVVESVGKSNVLPGEQIRVLNYGVRGKNASESGVKGTGIGLAETRRIAEAHDGDVKISSAAVKDHPYLFTTTTTMVVRDRRLRR